MAPLAPIITQTVATDFAPCPPGTQVAALTPDPAETDPGPFTYAIATDLDGVFAISGTSLTAAVDLTGGHSVGVTVSSAGGTSPEGSATILVGGSVAPPEPPPDDYPDNPNVPPMLPPDAPTDAIWDQFIVMATLMLIPRARNGVDFAVGKVGDKYEQNQSVFWDDALLGPRPDAEIEALARQLATDTPRPYTP
jgi:hypothetical protein